MWSAYPLKIAAVKKSLFGLGLINARILFLKIPKFSEFLESRLFHSVMVDGMKEFL